MIDEMEEYIKRADIEIKQIKEKLGERSFEGILKLILVRVIKLEDEVEDILKSFDKGKDEI